MRNELIKNIKNEWPQNLHCEEGMKIQIKNHYRVGKTATCVLESCLIDGALGFGLKEMLLMSGVLIGKGLWRNYKSYYMEVFNYGYDKIRNFLYDLGH